MASLPAMAVSSLPEDAGRGGSELAFLDFEGMSAILADSHRRVNGLRFVRPLRFLPYEVRHAKSRDRGHASCHIVHMAPETNSFFCLSFDLARPFVLEHCHYRTRGIPSHPPVV